jgi:hypothetical protein
LENALVRGILRLSQKYNLIKIDGFASIELNGGWQWYVLRYTSTIILNGNSNTNNIQNQQQWLKRKGNKHILYTLLWFRLLFKIVLLDWYQLNNYFEKL